MRRVRQASKIFHTYVTVVSLTAGFFVAVLSFIGVHFQPAYSATPFGGLVVKGVDEKKNCDKEGKNCKTCPKHMQFTDYYSSGSTIGLYVDVGTKQYDNKNFNQSGKYLLGHRDSLSNTNCNNTYNVYRIISAGTS